MSDVNAYGTEIHEFERRRRDDGTRYPAPDALVRRYNLASVGGGVPVALIVRRSRDQPILGSLAQLGSAATARTPVRRRSRDRCRRVDTVLHIDQQRTNFCPEEQVVMDAEHLPA